MLVNNNLLISLATAIHGSHWQNATARDLGVNVRQIHRWKIGEYEVPDGVVSDMVKIAMTRAEKLKTALTEVERVRKTAQNV
jgi:hypothetical protein